MGRVVLRTGVAVGFRGKVVRVDSPEMGRGVPELGRVVLRRGVAQTEPLNLRVELRYENKKIPQVVRYAVRGTEIGHAQYCYTVFARY